MVFFTCNGCGESLKKGQVEKHLSICRNCKCLSCIDCGKDFWGDDYKNHLKCISEDQKYGGKGFEAKANKGDVKQQQWIQRIQEAMKKPTITPNLKTILNQISTYDNIPRKKAKFQNWMKNSLRINNQALQDQVWEIFSEATSSVKEAADKNSSKSPENGETSKPSDTTEEIGKKSKRERKEERQKKSKKEKKDHHSEESVENGVKEKGKKPKPEEEGQDGADEDKAEKKKRKKKKYEDENKNEEESEEPPARKKQKHCESEEPEEGDAKDNSTEENEEENKAVGGKFNWKGTIKSLLRQAPDNELPIKKLRKKVIAQFYTVSSAQHKSEKDLLATFNKKITNNPKFRVLKERVKLIK